MKGGVVVTETPPDRRYAKPIVLPERLEFLTGPTGGTVELPRHLSWSGSHRYDLDRRGRGMDLYRELILEATKPSDLYTYLNESILKHLWDEMWLPTHVRSRWETRFPELKRSPPGATA